MAIRSFNKTYGDGNWTGDKKESVFVIKSSDQKPVLDIYLKYFDDTTRDLTGCTAKLVVALVVGGRRLIDEAVMNVVDPDTDGRVQYQWERNQLIAGEYLMEVLVEDEDGRQETFPRGSYYKLTIVPHL